MPEPDRHELQRVILDLTRTRQGKLAEIEAKEESEDSKVQVAAYERGAAWGLSVALNRLEEICGA